MARNQLPPEEPRSLPQTEPTELFPSNNIRFVMFEVAKLVERVDHLSSAIEKLPASFEKAIEKLGADQKERHSELKSDHKDTRDKVSKIESSVSFVRGAAWVFGGLFAILVVIVGVLAKFLFDKL